MDNGDKPASKQDLLELEERLRAHVSDTVHDSETKLLRAFFNWAESTQKRLDHLDRSDAGLGERTMSLERWMLEMQKRIEDLSRQRPPS